jgi:hypothetical protein
MVLFLSGAAFPVPFGNGFIQYIADLERRKLSVRVYLPRRDIRLYGSAIPVGF